MTDYDKALALMDEMIAVNQRIVADLRAVLDDAEPTATVETMTVGGWMQRPGSPRWLPIAAITPCDATSDCWRIDFDVKSTDPDGSFVHVGRTDAFPFLTADQFDAACEREQADAFPVTRLVEDQAVMDARAERELQQERAKDFGHDDPAAA